MTLAKYLPALAFCVLCSPVFAQDPLRIDTTNRCLYSGTNFIDLFAFSDEDPFVEGLVVEICRVMKWDRSLITLRNAIVPNAAAVITGKNRYLLYNQGYFYDNRSNTTLCRAILAHELAHLFSDHHKLDGKFRVLEETAADRMMADAVMRLDTASKVENLLALLRKLPFSYAAQVPWEEREAAVRRGWATAAALMEGPGFGINTADVENLPLPRFNMTGCPKALPVINQKFLNKKLKDIDECLVKALNSKGYTEISYFSVKNGFALVTSLERFENTGLSVKSADRFQDCPQKEQFKGVYDYITKLFWPQPTRMRLFVFIVNDQPVMEYEAGCLKDGEPREWLLKGGAWLPDYIGQQTFTKNHKVRALVYEFVVPDSIKKANEQCVKPLKIEVHLEKSGILTAIKTCL